MPQLARLVRTVVKLAENVLDEPQPDPVKLGDSGYADRINIGMLSLREVTTDTYIKVVDRVATSLLFQAALGLDEGLAGPLRVQSAMRRTA